MSHTFQINPTFCFTLFGTFVIFLWTRPRRSALLAVLLLASALRLACIYWRGGLGDYYGVRWISWGAFLGIATLIVLAGLVARFSGASHSAERRPLLRTFFAGAVFPLCNLLVGYTVPLTLWLRPKTYDAFLLAFDGGLGFQPSFLLGSLLPDGSFAWNITTVVYYALPLAVGILYAAHRNLKRPSVRILGLYLSLLIVGFAQYGIYPAAGPKHAFPGLYPWHPPALAQISVQPMAVPGAPRNCMPSLHFAGALAIWWNSRLWPRWGRALVFLFLAATVFSTLALGEHYLADLIVAFPFTLIFQSAWSVSAPALCQDRFRTIAIGAALTLLWIAALRFALPTFLISPLMSWSLVFFTVGCCLLVERNLARACR